MKDRFMGWAKSNIYSIVIGVACIVLTLIIMLYPNSKKHEQINLSEYSSVNAICELATLKSFYHNVVMYEQEPNGFDKVFNDILVWPFGVYTKVGYKQYWLEYCGIVETGIDAGAIQITGPDENNIVEVYIPEARIMNIYADVNSLSDPLTESGLFTTISGEEKTQAFVTAQNSMRQEAETDQAMLRRAKENAKTLLERYVVNTGKAMGMDLTVKWVEQN